MEETVALVRRSLAASSHEPFARRVEDQAATLREEIRDGAFDNADPALGLELECYVIDDAGRPAAVPADVFGTAPVGKELGVHNIEINTPASVFDERGVTEQAAAVRERLDAATDATAPAGLTPVLDAMWTIPPAAGTAAYLGATREIDGVVIAEHMADSPRYYALDNAILDLAGGAIDLDLPGAQVTVPSILAESLTSSIQPHLQVPTAMSFPAYHNTAVRTLGPVLALATNSPFLPADLYGDVDPADVIEETAHELRIPVFEQAINAGELRKVRFPPDLEGIDDIVDQIAADRTVAPFLREWLDNDTDDADDAAAATFPDTIWEFDHKHGTYWRWLRPVIGGDAIDGGNDERSLRLEYRPLPTQPSVRDIVGLQCLVAGLIHGLVRADHPLRRLDWTAARQSFYGAVSEGLEADLHWITADGDRTSDPERVFSEVFTFARQGLRDRGVTDATIDHYLAPIEHRWKTRTVPSDWKREQVARRVADGADLAAAIQEMQAAYHERTGTPFADWD